MVHPIKAATKVQTVEDKSYLLISSERRVIRTKINMHIVWAFSF